MVDNATRPQKPPRGSAQHRHVLHVMAALYGWRSICEVGVWKGDTGAYLLEMVPGLRWVGVDPYADAAGDLTEPGAADYRADMDEMHRTVQERLGPFGPRWLLLRCASAEAARNLDEDFDCVFVDADHRYDRVREDLEAWWPRVARYGWLAGHDHDMPSVRRAAEEFAEGRRMSLIELPDRTFAVRKT